MKQIIEKIIDNENLTIEEAYTSMLRVMNGEINNSHLAAFLIALKSKGETAHEIAGFAKAMREKSVKLNVDHLDAIDVCGTGGDDSGTFNISTAVSFVVAGAGIAVAKHGNRSISSISGSADVLTELGIDINMSPEKSQRALEEIGISFMFAPNYHPAMKHAAPVRKELGMKTVFNLLGPLTNPANTKKQLVGVFNDKFAKLLSEAADHLGMERVCFVCTDNKRDEVTLDYNTNVYEFNNDSAVKHYVITNESFGFPTVKLSEIKGDSPAHNARMIYSLLSDKIRNSAFYVVAANAALALYAAKYSENLAVCKDAAVESIESGKALDKLLRLKKFSEGQ